MLKTVFLCVVACLLGLASGCSRFRHEQYDTVYVSARHMYLHDRVAAVSERVGEVANGDELQVLEHNRRFLKVKTTKNQIGWIEQRAVIDSKTHDSFIELAKAHKDDPVTSTATLRDDLYMHVLPGRKSDNFYLIAGSTKVQLLARATMPRDAGAAPRPVANVPKAAPPGATTNAAPKATASAAPNAPDKSKTAPPAGPVVANAPPTAPPPAPIMEDWWLARDGQGKTGWLLGSRLDVDVPEAIIQYGEGQRFIGSWVLTKVTDPGSETPDQQIAEYLTVTAPLRSGSPFDFDDVRVFTWSVKHHRYETAFRLRPIQGFLPVRVSTQTVNGKVVPTFSFEIAGDTNVAIDPATGISRPAHPRTINYQMIDTRVMRMGPDMGPIPVTHDSDADKKAKDKKAAKKGRK